MWDAGLKRCGSVGDLGSSWFFLLLIGINTDSGVRVGIYVVLVVGGLEHFNSRMVPFTPENVFFGRAQDWPPQMFSLFFQKFCILCDKNYSEDVLTGIQQI